MIPQQIKKNLTAILSLLIALTTLSYITWRNEVSERNSNIRVACFEILKELGALQTELHFAYYEEKDILRNDITAGGRVLLIKDLSVVLPEPITGSATNLFMAWQGNWKDMKKDEKKLQTILMAIIQMRASTLQVLRSLR